MSLTRSRIIWEGKVIEDLSRLGCPVSISMGDLISWVHLMHKDPSWMWKAPFSRAGCQAEPLEACVHSFISLCSWLWVQWDHLFLGPHTVTAVALQPGTVKHNNPFSTILLLSGVLSAGQETNKWLWYQKWSHCYDKPEHVTFRSLEVA